MSLQIIRGDDVTLPVTFTDENGDPVNLTDTTVYFTVKDDSALVDDDAIIKKEVAVHTDALNGKTSIELDNTDTDQEPGVYYWDLQIQTEAGKITSTATEKIEIVQDITQRTE